MSKKRNSKYPGLDTNVNLRNRRELMDEDYIHKLSETEKLLVE